MKMPTEVAPHNMADLQDFSFDKSRALGRFDQDWLNQFVTTAELPGFTIHPGTLNNYVDLVSASIWDRKKVRVYHYNLHSLYEYFRSPDLKRYFADSVALVDGMPLVGLLRLAGFPVTRSHRLTYVDFIWPLLERARDEQRRVFIVGQHSKTLSAALEEIHRRLPELAIAGLDGYFDTHSSSVESRAVVEAINGYDTDMLLVGMGTPIQEQWVFEHADILDVPAVLVMGACMEYVAGAVRTPPRWMGRWGLEWSFRLLENPRRFAKRYFIEPWVLALMLMRAAVSSPRT